MDPNLRNLKDFLTLYNKVTELCFSRCVETLFERELTINESACVERCATKFARFNQKMMNVYVEIQTDINQKRMQELESNKQSQEGQPTTTSALPATTTSNTSSVNILGTQTVGT